MKFNAFFFINGLYLSFTIPIFAMTYLVFRFLIKIKVHISSDWLFVGGGIVYYIIDLMNEKLRFAPLKSMGNTVTELSIISLIYGLLFLGRSILGKYNPEKSMKYSLSLLFLYLLVAIIVFAAMPTIKE